MLSYITEYKAMPEGDEKNEEASSINTAIYELQEKISRSGRNDADSLISSLKDAWGTLPSTPESQDGGRRKSKSKKSKSKSKKSKSKSKSKKSRK